MSSSAEKEPIAEVEYDPFTGGMLEHVVPITEPQREIWLADKLGYESSLAFNVAVSFHLHGALDVAALSAAVQDLASRHESLRSTISSGGDWLCVAGHVDLDTSFSDLSGLAREAREAAVARALQESVDTPFDLERGPLIRSVLLGLAPDEHLLVLTAHHIICDGWSFGIIVDELAALYARHCGQSDATLAEPDSFVEFALANAARAGSAAHDADEAYWLSRFQDQVPVLELPTDRPRPSHRTSVSARVDHVLDAGFVDSLRRFSAHHGSTLFATLLAGFAGTLTRLAGQSTVVVGIPAAGQLASGRHRLVGHCVNLLPLRFDLDPARSFETAVETARTTLFSALRHQHYTFGTLLTKLRIQRDPSRMPLVSVVFNLEDASVGRTVVPGLTLDTATIPRSHETFELFVNAVQVSGTVRLECQYNQALFDGETVARWLRAYTALLRSAVEQPSLELGGLPLLDASLRAELDALQPAPTPFDRECRMHEHFEIQCDRAPDRVALRFGPTACRYGELERRANRVARLLRARGVGRGALVGLALDRGIDMVAALLGILKSGAAYVPLDPQFPAERLALMTGDSNLAALVTVSELAPRFDLRGRPVLALDALAAELDAADDSRIGRDGQGADVEDAAYVIYTSGSTGRPKGVRVPHRAVANFLASMRQEPGLCADDRLLAVTTLSFDIAVLELLLPLTVGAEVVLASREMSADGTALAALLADSGATTMQATPSTWRLLLEAGWAGSSTFKAMCGGEALAPDLCAQLLPRCGSLWNLYGPTETTVWSTCARVVAGQGASPPDVHIGRPIANTRIWVLDPRGEPCPRGVPGEIYIGGEGVSLGYLERPGLTAERFVPDRFSSPADAPSTALLYRTGDRGRWRPDGCLEHLGRFDHQVKVRGFRIELGDIEANLAAREEIANSLVIVREDQPNDQRLVAYVVPKPGAKADESALRAHLRARLPAYMVPQHFVVLDALPLLPNGKIDRNALPRPAAPIVVEQGQAAADLPLDQRTRYLATVWADLLGTEPGPDDNFFDLGGHSMLAVQMVNRVARETGVQLKLIRLGAETLSQLAADLPAEGASPPPSAGKGGRFTSGLRKLFGLATQGSNG